MYVRSLIAALVVVGATGCLVGENSLPGGNPGGDDDTGDPGGPDDPGTINRPIPSNGLVLDPALARQLPTGALGTKAADGTVTLGGTVLSTFGTVGGQALMKYVAICALPQDGAIQIGTARHDGYYGLAPEWASGACNESCQRWVSACLLAHSNANGTPVPIGLVGDRPSAGFATASQLAAFTFQEAAFYGNLFRGEGYACVGRDSFDANGFDPERFIDGRVCSLGGCGILSTGPCGTVDSPFALGTTPACERDATTPTSAYGRCHTGPPGEATPRTSSTYTEIITSYLKP